MCNPHNTSRTRARSLPHTPDAKTSKTHKSRTTRHIYAQRRHKRHTHTELSSPPQLVDMRTSQKSHGTFARSAPRRAPPQALSWLLISSEPTKDPPNPPEQRQRRDGNEAKGAVASAAPYGVHSPSPHIPSSPSPPRALRVSHPPYTSYTWACAGRAHQPLPPLAAHPRAHACARAHGARSDYAIGEKS